MPRLPNFLIHLSAFIRPSLLRPDIRVPNIGYVDFKALKSKGFNAVVIDKDNCITLPDSDEVYPPFENAWNELLETFPPGRVLVVSNSAGTKKDPGGIAAEAVALNLRAPVLVRPTPKPGCSPEILSYFRGGLGTPVTLRKRIHDEAERIRRVEKEDEAILLDKTLDDAEKLPLLGPLIGPDGKKLDPEPSLRDKMMAEEKEETPAPSSQKAKSETKETSEDPRILVIGDRLFTDTLLAHRLSKLLRRDRSDPIPSVLSIYTTTLPKPKDVLFLRWIEAKLSRGQVKAGAIDWGRYVRDPYADLSIPPLNVIEAEQATSLADKWKDWKDDVKNSTLRWDPRTWTFFDVVVGSGRGVGWFGRSIWALALRGVGAIKSRIGRGGQVAKEEAGALEAIQGATTPKSSL